MNPNQTPNELRELRYQIRIKELENEAIRLENEKMKLELETKKSSQVRGMDIKDIIKLIFVGSACAWSFAIFVMFCAIIFQPSLAETLDQFIVGFGGLAAGFFLGSVAQRMLDGLFS